MDIYVEIRMRLKEVLFNQLLKIKIGIVNEEWF